MVNTFLIGVQKAGTTSLYNWISQHPEVEGNWGLKDIPVLVDPDFQFSEDWLNKQYKENKKINIHGSVQYFFAATKFLKSADTYIKNGAKFILVLRHPVDRSRSALAYSMKTGVMGFDNSENRFSLEKEKAIMGNSEMNFFTKNMHTPILHSLYSDNLKTILEGIPKNQIKVLIYEELMSNPQQGMSEIFSFLNIDTSFVPSLKKFQVGGVPRLKWLKSTWKNGFAQKFIKPLVPYRIRRPFLKYLVEKNTKPTRLELSDSEKEYLMSIFREDMVETEKVLGREIAMWDD